MEQLASVGGRGQGVRNGLASLGGKVLLLRLGCLAVSLGCLAYLARSGWSRSASLLTVPPLPWPKTAYFIHLAWYWAAWAALLICLTGAAAASWLLRQPDPETAGDELASRGNADGLRTQGASVREAWWTGRGLALGVGLASVLLFIWLAWPRMSFGLWGDENMNFRLMAVGQFSRKADDKPLKFHERTFYDACFSYPDTNDHQLYSILGHASHNWLGGINRHDALRPWMTEWKYRLPALFGGIGGILLSGHLLRRLGRPREGLLLMPLLALHPWYFRYATEARGYALLFALVPLGLLFLLSALRTGRRRDWVGFGLVLALQLMANLNVVIMVALTGLAALGAVLASSKSRRIPQFAGLLLAAGAALLLWLPFFLPCLPGLLKYIHENQNHLGSKTMDALWFRHETALFLEGATAVDWDSGNPFSIGANELPIPVWILELLAAVGLLGGIYWMLRQRTQRWLLLPMVASPLLIIGFYAAQHFYLFPWYVVNTMPLLLGLVLIGWGRIGTTLATAFGRKAPLPSAIGWAVMLMVLLVFGWQTQPLRAALRDHSLEPIRETVRVTRQRINPFLPADEDVITVGIWFYNKTYDPFRIDCETVDELQTLMDRARREKKRLFADVGQLSIAHHSRAELMRLLDDPAQFQPVAQYWSTQGAENSRVVFQMIDQPGPNDQH